jgi:Leucine-rich repeat (LRR) protein
LDLSFNEIATLPQEIGKIMNLRVLNLRHNRLKSLPGQIGYLKNLQEMDLSQNKLFIYGFPVQVLQCKTLVKLNVADNQLEELPENLHELEVSGG